MARLRGLTAEQRRQVLDRAEASAELVPGWRRAELLGALAAEWHQAGDATKAQQLLTEAVKHVPADEMEYTRVMLGAQLARDWVKIGNPKKAGEILQSAQELVKRIQPIDQPSALAALAGACREGDNGDESDLLYERALAVAATLTNSRPRALAVIEVCRSLGRQRIALTPALRKELDALLAGLRDPW
jgi:tetratricopeptide (TPR) repeat protein